MRFTTNYNVICEQHSLKHTYQYYLLGLAYLRDLEFDDLWSTYTTVH